MNPSTRLYSRVKNFVKGTSSLFCFFKKILSSKHLLWFHDLAQRKVSVAFDMNIYDRCRRSLFTFYLISMADQLHLLCVNLN